MELEAKLSLQSKNDLNKVAASLMTVDPAYTTEVQEDTFFDSADAELEQAGTVFRIRTAKKANGAVACKATIKEHSEVADGSSVRWEQSDNIAADVAAACIKEPTKFLAERSIATATTLVDKFNLKTLMQTGAISTQRMTFKWASCQCQPGLVIRLDCTTFPFGERYELEVPHVTVPVHDVLDELNKVLTGLGVQAVLAKESKFQQLRSGTRVAAAQAHMVVEAKLSLLTDGDYHTVRNALQANLVGSETHENWFLDGFDKQLASRGVMFRVRLDRGKNVCLATIKEHSAVEEGGSLCWAQEEALPFNVGEQLKANPNLFFDVEGSTIAATLRNKFNLSALHYVGGFATLREVYSWPSCLSQPGLMIRLDSTKYPFGQRYEMEVPKIRVPVEDVVHELSQVLAGLKVGFAMGQKNKFQQFHEGMAKSFMAEAQ